MGLNKIDIKTKETLYERKVTFSKRRKGLLNKAKELSVMCDVPLMLLFFSPSTEKPPKIFLGDQCNFQQMIERYAAVPSKERYERKQEDFQLLKKLFAKQGKKIDAQFEQMCHPSGSSSQSEVEDKQNHVSVLQAEIKEVEKALGSLRYLSDIDSIDDTNLLDEMDRALQMHIHTLQISRDNGFDGHARAMIEQATVPQDWEAVPSEENTKIGVNPYLPALVVENPEPELDWLYTDVEWKNYEGPTPVADHAHDPYYQIYQDQMSTGCDQMEEAWRQSLLEAKAQYNYPLAASGDPGASSSQPSHATQTQPGITDGDNDTPPPGDHSVCTVPHPYSLFLDYH